MKKFRKETPKEKITGEKEILSCFNNILYFQSDKPKIGMDIKQTKNKTFYNTKTGIIYIEQIYRNGKITYIDYLYFV